MTATASRTTNRRPELLAPAGGPEPFAAALAAGADALYCGMGSFNARRKATNFTDEAFEQACRAAHLAGSRVYVTVNIVIKQSEMGDALQLIHRCSTLGADAFIIQDWGLFFEVKRTMPGIETHISTQANIHDDRGTIWCREQGADRVTLSRELSIDEIAAIHHAAPDVDLEVFSHGAICFCYSGLCLLSSFAMAGRSANRGMCAQPCRLPYELIDENGRALSPAGRERALCPRDTNTSQLVRRLYDAGAASLKLEGRMKAPDYVYSIVDVYRHEIDDMLSGVAVAKDEEAARQRQLKRCFNRDFTHAYQDGTSGDEMMSYERSNNRGQIVGTVLGSRLANRDVRGLKPDDRRRRAAIARIELFEPVGKGDLLELRHDDEFDQFLTTIAADDAAAGDIIECRVPRSMPEGCRVRVIRSQRAIDAAGAALKRDVLRRRAVDVAVVARLGEPFTVTLTCCDDPSLTATATGFTVEAAKTRAVEAADLVEHVGRMGSSPFEAASFDVALDEGCGMGFSAVHKVRAAACKALEEAILAPYEERARTLEIPAIVTSDSRPAPEHYRDEPQICATVTSLEAAEAARAEGATRIYMTTDALDAAELSPADALEQGIVPVLDEVCRAIDHERVDPWINAGATVAIGNISELALAAQVGATAEIRSCLPVHNTPCMEALAERGAGAFWLSPEITLDEIVSLGATAPAPLGITVFGRPRVMTSEHCILQVANGCIHDCANCRLRARKLSLKNIDGKVMPVRTDIHGRSRLYDAYPIDLTPQVPQLLDAGVRRLMVDGTLLEADEIGRAVARVRRAVEAAQAGRKPAARLRGATSGCMFVGISEPKGLHVNEEPQVLYCDAWLMAIDKPAGMIVHGDGTGERTLTDYASDLLLAMGDGFAATDMQPLNRLDRDTTGVVLFSLDKQTQPAFDQMIIDHAFEKHYLALAEGKIDWNEKLIDKPIARDRHDSRKMRVGASGKPSQTRVKVLKRLKSRRGLPTRSYIDVELLTGRKHQIRVHLASERHPLVGDDLYGTPRPCGLMLHAHSVSFTHPVTGEHIHIEAPCPWEP